MFWFSRIFGKSKEAPAPAVHSPAPDSGPEAAHSSEARNSEPGSAAVWRKSSTQSGYVGDSKPKFSEREILTAKFRAEDATRLLNESLKIANLSTSFEARNARLQVVRDKLCELKDLAGKYPFLHLRNLQEVEASIKAVEAETFAFQRIEPADSVSEYIKGNGHNRQVQKDSILMCIQSQFKVINESIEIAQKSKNLETKISRLGVARNTLKMAREQAAQFSLAVNGFEQAETAINRIQEALESGAPQKILDTMEIPIDMSMSSVARGLLKEATALKREKKYADACEKLRQAYSSDGAENLMIEERLRLPMYLLLAGRNDEGWEELNRLNARYVDQFSQPVIAHQMRVFRNKEGKNRPAAPVLERAKPVVEADNLESENAWPVGKTVGELQSKPMSAWGNADMYAGLRFSATMQLGKPLRVLRRHGETHTIRSEAPPQIAQDGSEGIWMPITKRFEEIACGPDSTDDDIQFFKRLDAGWSKEHTVASDVGPILPSEYFPFLLAVRGIIEAHDPIEHRIGRLREMSIPAEWQLFLSKHYGIDGIIERFFPHFFSVEFRELHLDTPNRVAAASDEQLSAIKGVGPVKLKAIRERCAAITENRDSDRAEDVIR
jgi:hypothetical protein